ncbi:glycosyltransferase family 48 protein [Atractiella rhizophila]|nr:glycosyltransferase family 48 protein [Atractiella rhizophila]
MSQQPYPSGYGSPPGSQSHHSMASTDIYRDDSPPGSSEFQSPQQRPHMHQAYASSAGGTLVGHESAAPTPTSGKIPYAPSEDSLGYPQPSFRGWQGRESVLSTPSMAAGDPFARLREPYPNWTGEGVPVTKEDVEDVFVDLTGKFGFQKDSMRNMYDHFMHLLDSRASRMSQERALCSLHADYIGGEHANYRKWYFAAQLDLDDVVGATNGGASGRKKGVLSSAQKSLDGAHARWTQAMAQMSSYDRVRQVALYLLLWGESAQLRFMPECLCFVFKCADDYYRSPECQGRREDVPEGLYLRAVVRPLYRYLRDQGYEVGMGGEFYRRERDHQDIVGYDDVNQLFWYPEGIARIVLTDKSRLIDYPPTQRFMKFDKIDWSRACFKTYYERRSFFHLLVNFNRIWVIHISFFWFFTSFNSPTIYSPGHSSSVPPHTAMTWSVVALGGAVATLIQLAATVAEYGYVPKTWNNTSHLLRRGLFLIVILALTAGPTIYVANNQTSNTALIVGIAQFGVSAAAVALYTIVPSGRMFGDRVAGKNRKYLANQTFTASYPHLTRNARLTSVALWILVFGCKFTESYFFLTLSFKNPIAALVTKEVTNCDDKVFGGALCKNQAYFTLAAMFVMDLILFFLDTFLWWIIWNTVFSVARSFHLGLSIWTPWVDIYARLPKRIFSKLLATDGMEVKYKPKVLVSQIWNAIIISMYREHLLSIEHVQHLLYHQVPDDNGKRSLRAPQFFIAQGDRATKAEFFPQGSEAERRISFFAQSLTTAIPESLPIDAMPTFTVLTPHYSEKILLSLREIIREEDQNTRVTLLEYMKQLHPVEWDNFVRDTKILAEESEVAAAGYGFGDEKADSKKTDDIPFYTIGFKSAAPEYTLRTRIWASLRAQTLYRTVSGFMNYSKAIKLLYRVENPEVVQSLGGNTELLERELERVARRKFKFVVSMQRYSKFSQEEKDNVEFLLRAYPDLQIAYLDFDAPRKEGGEPRIFSALIDGHCEVMENGKRRPKFRIELPGNPILGDGKSDNQNHAIIFHRGEYLQLVDANQDNYLEECLKIRNILGEFEELKVPNVDPYDPEARKQQAKFSPVAIVGAREYIFSENIGILGDVAAGKEQTFGTLAARNMAYIGGKLHYGHPDFLNAIYMTTRGGVSKAQKGLHLNEDIYAGMNAIGRGGRIKHTEYYQCGKGRDLGFGTILNFQTKIGTGMGEQTLSREYYYLGTQLPIDRFLTFYYGHPGFQINNIFVIFAIQLFVFVLLFLGTMNEELVICKYGPNGVFLGPRPCHNLVPVFDWIKRCIISIFVVFLIAFLPLLLQELTERGVVRALIRFGKQFFSGSPIFEVFSTQIQAHSILTNLEYGGARYIATGRGFATTRINFGLLYSRFAGPSIYLGLRTLVMLLYVTLTIWIPHLIYFWISALAFCLAPFFFNPHQFSRGDFFIDYREFLRWMSRGNSKSLRAHKNSWIGYCRLSRTQVTGYKKKKLGHPSEKLTTDVPRAGWRGRVVAEIIAPTFIAVILVINYLFVKSFDGKANGLVRILVIALGPIVFNAALLLILFLVSSFAGPALAGCCGNFGGVMAGLAHFGSVVGFIVFFEFLWLIELWNVSHAVLGLIAVVAVQRALFKIYIATFLSREMKHDEANRAWWTGKWYGRGMGGSAPFREYSVKIIEMSLFAADFLACHLLLFFLSVPLIIPYIDTIHSTMLFWLRPSKQIRAPIYSFKQRAQRRKTILKYGALYVAVIAAFAALIIVPLVFKDSVNLNNCSFCTSL